MWMETGMTDVSAKKLDLHLLSTGCGAACGSRRDPAMMLCDGNVRTLLSQRGFAVIKV